MPASPSSDFYGYGRLLDEQDRDLLASVRTFMIEKVEPVINEYWTRAEFPHELLPGFRDLGIAGMPYEGYGCPGRGRLADGMLAMELARTDPSIATFFGVHTGLAMGSVHLCGSAEQKQRWLPAMARMEQIGAFGLTEPDVGSGAAGELATSARRDGDHWVLTGRKKWIGNASFADVLVIWARDEADGAVKGFVIEGGSAGPDGASSVEGLSFDLQQDKIALRSVLNATVIMDGVRVPEADRLADANSFADTAEVLKVTRAGVAWMATGCGLGAYDHALRYAGEREQFGRPIGGFQLIQDLLVKMLANVTASTGMCVRLAQLADADQLTDEQASLAKVFCTVRMRESVGYARELLGGNGILLEHHVGRFVADAEAIYSYEGTREMNTLIVGKAITGHSAFV